MRLPGTPTSARATDAPVVGVLLIALLTGVVGCNGDQTLSETDRLLRQGRETFVAGDYARAGELFRLAEARDPANHQAVLGSARSRHALHEYGAAIAEYERAIDLAPGDPLTWRNYVEALYWGGVHAGNGERLERVLEIAVTALSQAPDSVETYEYVLRTAAELNRLNEYLPILESVVAASPDASVPPVERSKVLLEDARRARNAAAGSPEYAGLAERVEFLEAALGAELAAIAERRTPAGNVPPAVSYRMAVGYDLLGESDRVDEWLKALDRTAAGRPMATPMRYEQFLGEWVATFDEDPETRTEVTERWLRRFEPEWESNGDRYRTILGMQFDVMVAAARETLADAVVAAAPAAAGGGQDPTSDDSGVSEAQADRLARAGRELARIDSGRGAARFVEAVSVLARIPSHYVTAVRVADDGIEALRESRPGLLHPSTPDGDRAEIELRYTAVLMQLQGQALHNLGRDDEAERVLREAIALYPVSASYAVLGGLLLDQERAAEAFDLFVGALARGFGPSEMLLEEQTRASALEAAARIGASPEVVDQAIAFAAAMVDEERDREILADPLDLEAPDFELSGTDGRTWRLSELAGKVVVLNYWATWCGPCIAEMPYYQSLVDEYEGVEDVVLLAISTDSEPSVVAPFIEENGYSFNVLFDQGSAAAFGISGVPASLLIGKDGAVRYQTSGFPGPQRYLREMRLRIESLRAVAPSPLTDPGDPSS